MTYRIRLIFLQWYVLIFDSNGTRRDEESLGPFDKIEQAEEAAKATGYRDGDK